MNLSYFISKRISREQRNGFSSVIHTIAIISIGIGLSAIIIAFLIMIGFQETVKNKVYGFSGHILITQYVEGSSPEEEPMNYFIEPYINQEKYPFVDHTQEYAHKFGLIKTEDEVLGVLVKGVGKSFDLKNFKSNIIEGRFIGFPETGYANQIVLSKVISSKLKVNVGQEIVVHFFQDPPRIRKLKVVGIYETNLSEYFDSKVIISDIRMIRKLNDWGDSLAGGLEVFIKDQNKILEANDALPEYHDKYKEPVSHRYAQVFEWLNLLSRQVNILLVIILIVVCLNMTSIVLILVMERTQMIGMLKALGAGNKLIRSIFVYNGISLIIKGLVLGNVLGLGMCYLQYKFEFVKLNAQDYYMSVVPISWNWGVVLILNLLVFTIVTLVLLIPTTVISRVNPIKAIRFD